MIKSIINKLIYGLGILSLTGILIIASFFVVQKALVFVAYKDWNPRYTQGACVGVFDSFGPLVLKITNIHPRTGFYEVTTFVPQDEDQQYMQSIDMEIDGHQLEEETIPLNCELIEKMTI